MQPSVVHQRMQSGAAAGERQAPGKPDVVLAGPKVEALADLPEVVQAGDPLPARLRTGGQRHGEHRQQRGPGEKRQQIEAREGRVAQELTSDWTGAQDRGQPHEPTPRPTRAPSAPRSRRGPG